MPVMMSLVVLTFFLRSLMTSSLIFSHIRSYSLWTLQPLGASSSWAWMVINLLGWGRGCLARRSWGWRYIWRPKRCILTIQKRWLESWLRLLQSLWNELVLFLIHILRNSKPWGLHFFQLQESSEVRSGSWREVKLRCRTKQRVTKLWLFSYFK